MDPDSDSDPDSQMKIRKIVFSRQLEVAQKFEGRFELVSIQATTFSSVISMWKVVLYKIDNKVCPIY